MCHTCWYIIYEGKFFLNVTASVINYWRG